MAEEAKPIPPDDSPKGVEAVGNPSQDETQGVQETEEKVTGTTEDEAKGEMAAKEEAQIEEDKGEVDAKEEIQVEESAGEAKPGEKEEKAEEAGTEVVEEKVEEKAEAEEKAEEETAEKEEPEKEDAPEEAVEAGTEEVVEEESSEKEEAEIGGAEVGDVGESAGEEPTAEDKSEGEVDVKEVAQVKEGAGEAKPEDKENQVEEEETEEGPAAEEGAVAAGGEEEEAGLVSSEELSGGTDGDITDEEWTTWKKEFLNKFQKRFNNKWLLYGTGAFMLVAGLVVLLMGSNLRFTDTGEVKSLEEIAGPVYDMKFFLPLDAGASKTRFIKVTVAIELMDKGFKKEIDKKVSELRKEVIDLILSKSPKEVKSAQGKEKLRKEITTRLNKCLIREGIKNTYFTEMVVL